MATVSRLAPHKYKDIGGAVSIKLLSCRYTRPRGRRSAMDRICGYTRQLTQRACDRVQQVPELTIYGPRTALRRTPLVSFNVSGWNPMELGEALNMAGVESRAGCHCATLAHHALALEPPAGCRLSFYLYNNVDEVERATGAVRTAVSQGSSSKTYAATYQLS